MLNDEQTRPVTEGLIQNVKNLLFEPHPTIFEAGARREARLTSIIYFLFAFLCFLCVINILLTQGMSRNGFVLFGLALVATTAYILTRTRSYKTGSYLIVWSLVLVAFVAGDANRLTSSLYSNLILAILIASITFSFRYMVYFVILNNVAIGLMQFVYQDFTETSIALGLFIPYSLLTLIVMRHRNNVERDRIAAHEQLNHDLTILRQELEQTVQERTIKLEERVRQLHVITEVARTAASFQDIDRLLNSSTRLISESFGFYHVGIFLLDDLDQYAVLRAANSEGGQAMLAKMHTLPVDLTSIVGYVAKTQTPRIVLDTTADTVYFNNPDLPETRSEMAVPLKVGIRLIGILDVQSTHKDAFTEDDISILGTLGDQLAIAIDNTRLLTETRRALISAEQTYQRYFSQAWSQFASHYSIEGYRYHNGKLDQLREAGGDNQEDEGNMSKLRIPLMVRGQSIGILEVQPADGKQEWNPNELALLETTAERAALALENARLLEDAQRRAARESTISKISSKIGETSETEKIMAAAVAELRQALGAAEVVLNLNTDHQTK